MGELEMPYSNALPRVAAGRGRLGHDVRPHSKKEGSVRRENKRPVGAHGCTLVASPSFRQRNARHPHGMRLPLRRTGSIQSPELMRAV